MSIANELQRITNAKNLIGQKAVGLGLTYDDDGYGIKPLTLDGNGNPEQTIDIIASAIDGINTYEPEWIEEHAMSLEVDETGNVKARVALGSGVIVTGPVEITEQLTVQDAKTITPTSEEQVAVAKGKFTTGEIKVAAIPENFVDVSDITKNSSHLTVNKNAVTVPAGYYPNGAQKNVTYRGDVREIVNPMDQTEFTIPVEGYVTNMIVEISSDLEYFLTTI